MRRGWMVFSAALVLALLVPALAEGEGVDRTLVGKVAAVDVASRTLVVDVPLDSGPLVLGALVDRKAAITLPGGKPGDLASLSAGAWVRVTYHREPAGPVATVVEGIPEPGGKR